MQVIVFDFFGVICSEIAPFVLPKYMSQEAAVAYKASIVGKADVGAISQDEMFAELSQLTGAPPAQLEAEFWSFVRIDSAMVALIEELRGKYRVALLTNAVVPFFRLIMKEHALDRLFDVVLVSSEEGLAKPDPAFYTRMIDKLGVRGEDCLFIDDNPVNLDAARAVGMRARQFEGVQKLRRELLQAA
jgi:HAD superfamily hydrolase (TIGR01509 family)